MANQQEAVAAEAIAKFEELAVKRIDDAVTCIRRLRTLSMRRRYPYTRSHVDAMFGALTVTVKEVEGAFRAGLENKAIASTDGFSFTLKK